MVAFPKEHTTVQKNPMWFPPHSQGKALKKNNNPLAQVQNMAIKPTAHCTEKTHFKD